MLFALFGWQRANAETEVNFDSGGNQTKNGVKVEVSSGFSFGTSVDKNTECTVKFTNTASGYYIKGVYVRDSGGDSNANIGERWGRTYTTNFIETVYASGSTSPVKVDGKNTKILGYAANDGVYSNEFSITFKPTAGSANVKATVVLEERPIVNQLTASWKSTDRLVVSQYCNLVHVSDFLTVKAGDTELARWQYDIEVINDNSNNYVFYGDNLQGKALGDHTVDLRIRPLSGQGYEGYAPCLITGLPITVVKTKGEISGNNYSNISSDLHTLYNPRIWSGSTIAHGKYYDVIDVFDNTMRFYAKGSHYENNILYNDYILVNADGIHLTGTGVVDQSEANCNKIMKFKIGKNAKIVVNHTGTGTVHVQNYTGSGSSITLAHDHISNLNNGVNVEIGDIIIYSEGDVTISSIEYRPESEYPETMYLTGTHVSWSTDKDKIIPATGSEGVYEWTNVTFSNFTKFKPYSDINGTRTYYGCTSATVSLGDGGHIEGVAVNSGNNWEINAGTYDIVLDLPNNILTATKLVTPASGDVTWDFASGFETSSAAEGGLRKNLSTDGSNTPLYIGSSIGYLHKDNSYDDINSSGSTKIADLSDGDVNRFIKIAVKGAGKLTVKYSSNSGDGWNNDLYLYDTQDFAADNYLAIIPGEKGAVCTHENPAEIFINEDKFLYIAAPGRIRLESITWTPSETQPLFLTWNYPRVVVTQGRTKVKLNHLMTIKAGETIVSQSGCNNNYYFTDYESTNNALNFWSWAQDGMAGHVSFQAKTDAGKTGFTYVSAKIQPRAAYNLFRETEISGQPVDVIPVKEKTDIVKQVRADKKTVWRIETNDPGLYCDIVNITPTLRLYVKDYRGGNNDGDLIASNYEWNNDNLKLGAVIGNAYKDNNSANTAHRVLTLAAGNPVTREMVLAINTPKAGMLTVKVLNKPTNGISVCHHDSRNSSQPMSEGVTTDDGVTTYTYWVNNSGVSYFYSSSGNLNVKEISFLPDGADDVEEMLVTTIMDRTWSHDDLFGNLLSVDTKFEDEETYNSGSSKIPGNTLRVVKTYANDVDADVKSGITQNSTMDLRKPNAWAEFRVSGEGVVVVEASSNGPHLKELFVTTETPDVMFDYGGSYKIRDGHYDNLLDSISYYYQYTREHTLYAEATAAKGFVEGEEKSIYVWTNGGVHINSIRWVPKRYIKWETDNEDPLKNMSNQTGHIRWDKDETPILVSPTMLPDLCEWEDRDKRDENNELWLNLHGTETIYCDPKYGRTSFNLTALVKSKDSETDGIVGENKRARTPIWWSSEKTNVSNYNNRALQRAWYTDPNSTSNNAPDDYALYNDNVIPGTSTVKVSAARSEGIASSRATNYWGVMYMVAGTREGNIRDYCRVEIAGPAQGLTWDTTTDYDAYPIAINKDYKHINGGEKAIGDVIELEARPWCEAEDEFLYREPEDKKVLITVEDKTLTWTSSNPTVATVDYDKDLFNNTQCIVNVVGEGTATITAKTVNGHSVTYTLVVPGPSNSCISLTPIHPVDIHNVAVTDKFVFKARGIPMTSDKDIKVKVYPYGDTDDSHKVAVTGKVYEVDGDFFVEFDVISKLKEQTGGYMTALEYGKEYRFEYVADDDFCLDQSFNFFTETQNANVETFIYNTLQREKSELEADIAAGKLLSEQYGDDYPAAQKGNDRSDITISGFVYGHAGEGVDARDFIKTNGANAVININPLANQTIEDLPAIESVEINTLRDRMPADQWIRITWIDGEGNEIIGSQTDLDYAHNYTGSCKTPGFGIRKAKVEFSGANIEVSQIKINYYSVLDDMAPASWTFQEYGSGIESHGVKDHQLTPFADKVNNTAPIVEGHDFAYGNSGDAVHLRFKESQQYGRYFNIREAYVRNSGTQEANYVDRGEKTSPDFANNVLVIADDEFDPCTMFFYDKNNKASISSIEFFYEIDNEKNGYVTGRRMFCPSDPRYNPVPGFDQYVGFPLEERPLTDADKNMMIGTNKDKVRKMVYRPESPASFAAICTDRNEDGFLFIRQIVVRFSERGCEYVYKYNPDHDAYDVTTTTTTTTVRIVDPNLTAIGDRNEITTGDYLIKERNKSYKYMMKRTSLENNLTLGVALQRTTELTENGNPQTIDLKDRNGLSTETAPVSLDFKHDKFYTVRVLNENRIVIRQLGFQTTHLDSPQISHNYGSGDVVSKEYAANMPIQLNNASSTQPIRLNANPSGCTEHNTHVLIWTEDGTEPSVTFDEDGRNIIDVHGRVGSSDGWGVANLYYHGDRLMNNTIILKAISLPLKSAPGEWNSDNNVNIQTLKNMDPNNSYGESSLATRAYYPFVDNNTDYIHFNEDMTLAREDLGESEYAIEGGKSFKAGFTKHSKDFPSKDGKFTAKLATTYGGYEYFDTETKDTETASNVFRHDLVKNDYWKVVPVELANKFGINSSLVNNAYVESNLEPLNEDAINGGYNRTNREMDFGTKFNYDYEYPRIWRGEFNHGIYTRLKSYSADDENVEQNKHHYKIWSLPCYGDYFTFEPEADGDLTVYVRQPGAMEMQDNVLDDVMVKIRPVYIYDEAGNTPSNIEAYTTSKVAGHWNTTLHTEIVGDRYLNAEQSETFIKMCQTWIKNNTTITDEAGNMLTEFGDRAYKPQGLIMLHKPDYYTNPDKENGTTLDYSGILEDLREINKFDDGEDEVAERNGFMLISEGYVRYKFPVKAGKTYFMFCSHGKLGLCAHTFEPTANSGGEEGEIYTIGKSDASDTWKNAPKDKPVRVKLDRAFKNNTWAALVLPFSIGKTELRRAFGDGVRVIHFDEITTKVLRFSYHAHQMVVAGTPVFIKPYFPDMEDGASIPTNKLLFNNVTIELENTDTYNYASGVYPLTKGEGELKYMCTGSYGDAQIPSNAWYISGGKFVFNSTSKTVPTGGTRAWIIPRGSSAQAQAYTLSRCLSTSFSSIVDFDQEDDNVTTGFIEIISDPISVVTDQSSNNIYNLKGQLIRRNSTDVTGLPKGVYIVNGVKQVVE